MITLTENLKQRVSTERQKRNVPTLMLRVAVDSGGCSGFQYRFSWEETAPPPDDAVYGEAVVIDNVSLPLLRDATIDFIKTLMGEDFKITNPAAVSGCGCGQSFAV